MAVVHFAAYAYVGESVFKNYINNVKSRYLFEAIVQESLNRSHCNDKNKLIPIVFSSSCSTYGIPNEFPIIETTEQKPINPYGKSKLMVENILQDFYISYKIPSLIFRYFNAAGADPAGDLGENHTPELI